MLFRSIELYRVANSGSELNQPSRYFEKLAPDDIQVSQTKRSITQPALVAALRRMASYASDEDSKFAAKALKTLASNGVRAADPL